jgi:hypothetical protein
MLQILFSLFTRGSKWTNYKRDILYVWPAVHIWLSLVPKLEVGIKAGNCQLLLTSDIILSGLL